MKKTFILFLFFTITTVLFLSCKKNENPKAVVYVIDEEDRPVVGAKVELFSRPNGTILEDREFTGEDGKTFHEFVFTSTLDVLVEKEPVGHYNKRFGEGEIDLEYDKTVSVTIVISEQVLEEN